MNTNDMIFSSLKNANKEFHEAAECIDCKPGAEIIGGEWTTMAELGKLKKSGIPQYFDGENILLCPFSHLLITGSTGTGKTETLYKNFLKVWLNMPIELMPSLVVFDYKGDMSTTFAPVFKERGAAVHVINCREPYKTSRYNPLTQMYDDYTEARDIYEALEDNRVTDILDGVKYPTVEMACRAAKRKRLQLLDGVERANADIAHIVVRTPDPKDASWYEGAKTMLQAIIQTSLRYSDDAEKTMTRDKFTLTNICNIAYSTGDDCAEIIEWLEKADDIPCVKSAINSNYNIRAKQTRDSYISTLNTALGGYSTNAIEAITATSNDINLREIAGSAKPHVIFVVTDERQKTTNNICMMFINNLINELVNAADMRASRSLARDFVILADEFANMPAMPNISNKITTLRSRRVWMVMAIQSIAQLEMVYDKDVSTVIQDNCDRQIFLGCNNDETKELFVRSMGRKIGVKSSFNISNDGSISINKGTEDVPVIRKSDLDTLKLGEFYVRTRGSQSYKSYMLPSFMQKDIVRYPMAEDDDGEWYEPGENRYEISDSGFLKSMFMKRY